MQIYETLAMSYKLKLGKIYNSINIFLKVFYFYLAFIGIFSFSAFIMEEANQILTFSQFSASSHRNYAAMKDTIELSDKINKSMRFIADYALWLIPPQQIAYRAYADSQDQYNHVLRQEILANQPDLFLGQYVNITGFKYLSYGRTDKGHWELKNRDITVIVSQDKLAYGPTTESLPVAGKLRRLDGRLTVFAE
jgi:uncharacterized membrane protein YcgQ (UPF0703/DUF1980 family)